MDLHIITTNISIIKYRIMSFNFKCKACTLYKRFLDFLLALETNWFYSESGDVYVIGSSIMLGRVSSVAIGVKENFSYLIIEAVKHITNR